MTASFHDLITDGTMPTGRSFSAFQKLCTPAPKRVMAIFGAGLIARKPGMMTSRLSHSSAKAGDSFLASEKLLQGSANLRYIHGSDFPHDPQLHVGVVMGNDIAHATHFSEGEFWDGLAGGRAYVRRSLTD